VAPHDRGEYRPIFTALIDGADFLRLSAEARAVLIHIKLRLGPLGLGVHPGADSFARSTGFTRAKVVKALAEIAAAGWTEEEGSLLWLVRGLAFEPQMNPRNSKLRKFVADRMASFPRLAICDRFRERYADFFGSPTDSPSDDPSDRSWDAHPPTPTPTTNTKQQVVGEARPVATYLGACCAALNLAVSQKWPATTMATTTHREGLAGIAEAWERDGITALFACAHLADAVTRMDVRREPPRSLRYFDRPMRTAWEKANQKAPAVTETANPFGTAA
jgi:hypothetical protein